MRERLSFLFQRTAQLLRHHPGLVLVLVVAFGFRLTYLRWFREFPPGDVFNFIGLAEALADGQYPLDEKRLPFYPLLILLVHLFVGWEGAAVGIAVVASLMTLVFLYGIGRTLGCSRTALTVGLLLAQAHPQFVIASTRGYADTLFLALLAGGVWTLLRFPSRKGAIATGFFFGAAALTRYEGAVAAALCLAVSMILFPKRWRLTILSGSIAFLFLLPYIGISLANDRPLLGAGYAAEAAVEAEYGVSSWGDFQGNLVQVGRQAGVLGWWAHVRDTARDVVYDPFGMQRVFAARITDPEFLLTTFVLLGILVILRRRRWREFLLLTALGLGIALPIAWYRPLPRYGMFVFVFVILFFSVGLSALQRFIERATVGRSGRLFRIATATLLLLFVGGVWLPTLGERLRDLQQKHNGRQYAFYLAIRAAQHLPGVIAFDTHRGLTQTYFGDRALYADTVYERGATAETSLAALRERNVTYIVARDGHTTFFPFLGTPALETVESFSWTDGARQENRAAIYRLLPQER